MINFSLKGVKNISFSQYGYGFRKKGDVKMRDLEKIKGGCL